MTNEEDRVKKLGKAGELKVIEILQGLGYRTRRSDIAAELPNGWCFVEVKNCTLVEGRVARFPDAVTARGRKHLVELQRLVSEGNRGVMFFLVQRMDADSFSPADHIDPAYGEELRKAHCNGVEILVYDVSVDLTSIRLNREIPYTL